LDYDAYRRQVRGIFIGIIIFIIIIISSSSSSSMTLMQVDSMVNGKEGTSHKVYSQKQ
jgi:hypothetical protein